jgi:hypothetical protein
MRQKTITDKIAIVAIIAGFKLIIGFRAVAIAAAFISNEASAIDMINPP